ncbi:hypothetical protein FO519_005463 [Halicephalobus sp. NKZ332]|nr:hypothetical protein FO519_005463 [Halicephalobus sp. NKZ332]
MLAKVAPTGPNIIADIQKELFSGPGESISAWLDARPKPPPNPSIRPSLIRPDEAIIASTPKKVISDSTSTMDCVTCPKCFHIFNVQDGLKADTELKKDQLVPDKIQKVVDGKDEYQKSILEKKVQNSIANQSTDSSVSNVRAGRFTRLYEARTGDVNKNSFGDIFQMQGFKESIVGKVSAEAQKDINENFPKNQLHQQVTLEKKTVDETQKKDDRDFPQNQIPQKTDSQKIMYSDQRVIDEVDLQNQVRARSPLEKTTLYSNQMKTDEVLLQDQVPQQIPKVPSYWNQAKKNETVSQNQETEKKTNTTEDNENKDLEEIAAEMKLAEIFKRRKAAEGKVVYQDQASSKRNELKGVSAPQFSEESVSSYASGPSTAASSSSLYSTAPSKSLPSDDYYVDLGTEEAPRFEENTCPSTVDYGIELKNLKSLCAGPADLLLTNRKF